MTNAKATTTQKRTAKATASKDTTGTKPRAAKAKPAAATSAQQTAAIIPAIEAAGDATDDALRLELVLVTVQQEVFTKALETVMPAIPTTQGHASLLDRLRLTTNPVDQTMTLTGFNLIVGLEVSIPANVEGAGDWTVSASKLLKLMQHFPSGAVTLGWEVGKVMSIVSRTAGPFEVTTRVADDCPTIPVPVTTQRFELTNAHWGLKCAVSASGEEDFRCVHLHFWSPTQTTGSEAAETVVPPAGVTLTSTKKEAVLAFYSSVEDGTELASPDRTVSVAGDSIQKLVGLLDGRRCQVELDAGNTEDAVVRFVLTSQTVAKTFVNSESTSDRTLVVCTCRTDKVEAMNGCDFIPPDPLPVEISLDRGQLLKALYRQSVITDKQAAVAVTVGDSEIILSSEGAGIGVGTDTLSAQVKGEPMTIKFNPEFLVECLQALQSNQARLSFTAPTEPAYIRDSERNELFFVLAPAG